MLSFEHVFLFDVAAGCSPVQPIAALRKMTKSQGLRAPSLFCFARVLHMFLFHPFLLQKKHYN